MNFELLRETMELLEREVAQKKELELNESKNNLQEVAKAFKPYYDEFKEMNSVCVDDKTIRLVNKSESTLSFEKGYKILKVYLDGLWTSTEYVLIYENDRIGLKENYMDTKEIRWIDNWNKEYIDKFCNTLILAMRNWDKVRESFKNTYIREVEKLTKELEGGN